MTDTKRGLKAVAALGLFLACAGGLGLRGRGASKTAGPPRSVPARVGPTAPVGGRVDDPELASKTIAFWEAQAARDPQGALERRELAAAYLARQRETGDVADAVKAEAAARQSLAILPRNNAAGLVRLARSLLTQHRFPEALEAARAASAYDPSAARLVADVQIELGDYDEAARTLAAAPPETDDPNYDAVKARLEAVDGHPDAALRHLRKAERITRERPDMPPETVAWYHAMVGHALVESGRLDEGEAALRQALDAFPRDYRAMTGMAEAAAWRGDWRSAIDWASKAVAVAPQNPAALKVLADGNAALGRDDEANRQADRLEALARSFPRIYDRNWAMFCAEKGRDLDGALALARKDLELRHDVHAYDTLAWVCFQKEMLAEAESAIRSATARGTREAVLFYHAGMIARASGDPARAKAYFTQARDINPRAIPRRWLRWLGSEGVGAPTPASK